MLKAFSCVNQLKNGYPSNQTTFIRPKCTVGGGAQGTKWSTIDVLYLFRLEKTKTVQNKRNDR
ncbi:hypothetical protein T01_7821 [Trichinella spiralis]|uniref:Uncharacterized protein n=1 Tax=Trichinella spiralis TaxID=6334 RepID=A0A0V1B1F5_TRISP|nr:hypothetical protein T01_7821 [Trichinella spiralis]